MIVALVLDFVKRDDAHGTWHESHFRWRIHSVLWAMLAYLASGVLFILALRGLSSPGTSRAGNRYGMIGMGIALVTTLVTHKLANITEIMIAIGIGATLALRAFYHRTTIGLSMMAASIDADGAATTTGGSALAEVVKGTTPTWRSLLFNGVLDRMTHGRAVPCCSVPDAYVDTSCATRLRSWCP